jgi:hypothetical protein
MALGGGGGGGGGATLRGSLFSSWYTSATYVLIVLVVV